MALQSKVLLVGVFFFLFGCQKSEETDPKVNRDGYESVNLTRVVSDVMLSTELWDRMEKVFKTSQTTGFGSEGKAEEKKEAVSARVEVPTQYMAISAYLSENELDALGGRNFEFKFGVGGGELDLKNYVKKGKRKFTFSVELNEPYDAKDTLRVYFLSNAKEAKMGLLDWGAGCFKYMDITNYFKKTLSGRGTTVSALDLRYLRVLAGSFFFVLSKKGSLYLSHLKVTDSRYKNILCR